MAAQDEKEEFYKYADEYFDYLKDHIEILEQEKDLLRDHIKKDEMVERITYLKTRLDAGDLWVDNDITRSPDAWKTLETFTEDEAIEQFRVWDRAIGTRAWIRGIND